MIEEKNSKIEEVEEESIEDVPDLVVPDDEEKRLGRKPPLRTVLILSIGPLISQLVNALYGLVDSLWVAKTLGGMGVAVFGAVYVVEFISVSVSQYLNNSVSARVSFLFGQQRGDECSQLYIDFIRVAMVLAVAVPCVVLPIVKPLVKWFGAENELADWCFWYMVPRTCGAFINYIYQMGCGLIQAEGRSVVYASVQATAFILNMAVFDPLFLLGFRTPIWGASLATVCSEAIPGLTIVFLVFKGKLSILPRPAMFFRKFSPQTWSALRVGFSSFIQNISLTLPVVLMQKFYNNAALAIGTYDIAIQIWAVIEKLYQITGGICLAFSQGLLPTASYAYGAGRLNRFFWLVVHAYWLATSITLTVSLIFIAIPGQIASIWNDDPEFVKYATDYIRITFYASVCFSLQYIAPTTLQAMKRVLPSTLLSILTLLIPYPLFSTILYFTKKDSPRRVMFTYTVSDAYSFLVSILFMIKPIKLLLNSEKSDIGEFASETSSNDVSIDSRDEEIYADDMEALQKEK
ncbi:MatE family protein [Tritrichomonas foetus]|uniref:MatE family protein n=1 Tax=Tritrichomonas foetus TaxID=1144522 RepID=A0A1J4JHS4_9EUKA|nr:MatE family protein [Tritrichomonas foetus]|eukprot:OHS98662.1 MatE family protein [Tritrichomonas foetus]